MSQERVASIFVAAGEAFQRLGDLTNQLSSASSTTANGGQENNSSQTNKWTDEEVRLLNEAVTKFADDLAHISERIKVRTVGQITNALKKKAFDQAGIQEQEEEEEVQQQQQVVEQQQQQQQPALDDDGIDFDS